MSAPIALNHSAALRGMALGIASYTLFAVHDALVKSVILASPVVQILFVRSVVIVAICLVIGRRQLVVDLVRSGNKPMLLLRAILTLAAWCMYYSAGREMQLAEMTTLYYFAPVITIVLAVIFLKEQLTLARVGAAAIGFFGVLVASNPAGLTFGIPALMVLGAAFFWAVAMILMRSISKSESSMVLIFSLNLFYTFAMGLLSIPLWTAMDPLQVLILVATGIVGGTAQYVLVEAARLVPASVLGTVEYFALIWSFVFGFLFWGEQPAGVVFIGAALVIVAGLVLAWSERRPRRPVVDAP
ncbi:DMT family transporter [Devosia sp. ZB163]|uniref:DMT family transporter n=1 Tax=Devosia sp. ZB163 TaxID=3025938 RepID=UPI00235DD0CA|nr:DMT family transporter [Devosia sp. ZB163]MDC9826535.1 DMT family transporter [Devosia sp. ZB163]